MQVIHKIEMLFELHEIHSNVTFEVLVLAQTLSLHTKKCYTHYNYNKNTDFGAGRKI